MLRFYIALWAGKFFAMLFRIIGHKIDDRPGLLANKIDPQFLARVAKPDLVIAVTGTNGKTTTTNLIREMFIRCGKKTGYSCGDANEAAAYALNLLYSVNIFNKCKTDVAIMEANEATLCETMTKIRPNYILVTNICIDSLRRSGHAEHGLDCVRAAFSALGSSTTAILNANDPVSSQAAEGTGAKVLFYGMADIGAHPFENLVRDISICPLCGADIRYDYRIYRHIGGYRCRACDWKTPVCSWFAEKVDLREKKAFIREGDRLTEYPLLSDSVHNAFNVLASIALLRSVGFDGSQIAAYLSSQVIPKNRENCVQYNGVSYYSYACKGQNSSAASTVFEFLANRPGKKALAFYMDELQDRNHPLETTTWLYTTDHEFLNCSNIVRIVLCGHMAQHYRLRLMLAGIGKEKIVIAENRESIPRLICAAPAEEVYVLFETDFSAAAAKLRDDIVTEAKRIREEAEHNA